MKAAPTKTGATAGCVSALIRPRWKTYRHLNPFWARLPITVDITRPRKSSCWATEPIWIWYLFGRQFPGAIQILDFYHACEHLAKVANAIYGKDTDLSRAWQKAAQAKLKANGVLSVVKSIQAWQPNTQEHREIRRIESAYFTDNAQRMHYQTYLEKGYQIGSGVVEATCKHVVHQRLDQAGMHWRTATAEAIVTLRAAQLSTSPTDLRPHLAMVA